MRSNAIAAFLLTAVASLAFAQPVIGPYVSLGAGVNLQQDEIRESTDGARHFFSFDPGAAGQFNASTAGFIYPA